jgi:hypothetical protein
MSNPNQLAKILFSTEDGQVETLWAAPLGNALYQLENSPWFAYGVSWQDIIEAHAPEKGELPAFQRVVEKSGNQTLRLLLDPSADQSEESQRVLDKLVELGCSYEGANPTYIAINIPPPVDLWTICNFLTETGHQWEHADPPYEELHPSG